MKNESFQIVEFVGITTFYKIFTVFKNHKFQPGFELASINSTRPKRRDSMNFLRIRWSFECYYCCLPVQLQGIQYSCVWGLALAIYIQIMRIVVRKTFKSISKKMFYSSLLGSRLIEIHHNNYRFMVI